MVPGVLGTESARRRQFSSCDYCRKSRIACDASQLQRHQQTTSGSPDAGSSSSRVQCTNCSKRALLCTYEWIRDRGNRDADANRPRTRQLSRRLATGRSRRAATRAHVANSPEPSEEIQHDVVGLAATVEADDHSHSELSRQTEARVLHDHLWTVFTLIFEPVLTLWTGPDCSPYVVPDHMSSLTMLQLAVSLDWANCTCNTDGHVPHRHHCPRGDRAVQLALISSVHAFSFRWLPLVTDTATDSQQLLLLGDRLWNNAKSRIMAVFDKLSYQTALALYLFGLTPISKGASVDVENAHSAGEVSIDMALRQIHRLRVKRRDLRFSGTGLSVGRSDGETPINHNSVNEDFIHAENMMYWAGVVFDTSSSMTRGCPSILCSGVFGFEEEPVFRLMKARVQLFHESTESWRQNGFVPTSQATLYIVHRASTWKGYTWKIIGALREAINHGYGEAVITRLQTLIAEALNRFDRTFKPLLAACEKHILFFSKDARLCYYLLQMHYYMGLLLLCSLAVSMERTDMVPMFDAVRRDSVHAIFSTISFGLSCQVPLSQDGTRHTRKLSSLISLDPYPHHILASLQLATHVLLIYLKRDEITQDAFDNFCRIVFDALDELPQCLQSVQRVKKLLHETLSTGGHHLDTVREPAASVLSTSSRQPHQQRTRNDRQTNNETMGSEESSDVITGTNQLASSFSKIDEAGLGCLAETLFAGPSVVLSTRS
ncbi:uncharacterized protein Triagg1_5919 [Trichoderma aggressivum f. europaeum]|uniref:Zn(2)-C6 fungal-type domain-containing protein n=1 Tax=Trichoderma aggressivum f. europaeum TaxID=173218 RepID=A0AAE1LZX4_9HYPO|nr:hypothetical protein Triagg1_5919 [Trichoderma aggressivum f. europaeum]